MAAYRRFFPLALIALFLFQSCSQPVLPTPTQTPTSSGPPNLEVTAISNPNHVSAMALDGDHYLWTAGKGGVARWDLRDNSYQRFTPDEGMPALEAYDVQTDRRGVTWVRWGWQKGVSRFEDGDWQHFTDIPSVQSMLLPSGQFWALTYEELYLFDDGQWILQNPSDVFGNGVGVVLSAGPDGNLYALTSQALLRFNDSAWEELKALDGMVQANGRVTFAQDDRLFFTKDGALWVETMPGLSVLYKEEWRDFDDFKFSDVSQVIHDGSRSGYWLSAKIRPDELSIEEYKSFSQEPAGGVFFIDQNFNVEHYDTLLKFDGEVLLNRSVRDIFQDKNDTIWIATMDGVGFFNDRLNLFDALMSASEEDNIVWNFRTTPGAFQSPDEYVKRIVWNFFDNPWGMVIAHEVGGIYVYNSEDAAGGDSVAINLVCLGDLESKIEGFEDGGIQRSYSCDRDGTYGKSLIASDGKLLISNDRHGVLVMDAASASRLRASDQLPHSIFSMDIDVGGTLWLGSDEGLHSFDGMAFSLHTQEPTAFLHVEVDPEDRLWASYSFGILQKDGDNWITWEPQSDKGNQIAYIGPDDLVFTDDGVWGVNNYGVMHLPVGNLTPDSEWEMIDLKAEGILESKSLNAIGSDGKGGIWVSRNLGGTAFFDGEKWQSYTWDDREKLALENITRAPDGTLWAFVDENGLVVLKNGVWQPFEDQPLFDDLGSDYSIYDIAFEPDGTGWFAASDGLLRLGGDGWHLYTTANSNLPYEFIKSIAVSSDGSIWLASAAGHALVRVISQD